MQHRRVHGVEYAGDASTASPIHSRRVALGVSSMVSRGCILPLTAYARKFESEQHSLAVMRPLWSPLPRGYRALLLGKGGYRGRPRPGYSQCSLCCFMKASARFAISSGDRSSWWVAIHHWLPAGSFTPPMRSPQNWSTSSSVEVAPACSARW